MLAKRLMEEMHLPHKMEINTLTHENRSSEHFLMMQ